ncbi:hypothetical protein BJV74DRAFT_811637 [Russula compacta]|nr:hypothetical protein BJV74DRAFT_811637 [Russula compacta]
MYLSTQLTHLPAYILCVLHLTGCCGRRRVNLVGRRAIGEHSISCGPSLMSHSKSSSYDCILPQSSLLCPAELHL